jgi:ribosomal protein RSM22 (predicted rRNA methylase)
MHLPERLRQGIAALTADARSAILAVATANLSSRYRAGRASEAARDRDGVIAYVASRMPATFGAAAAALEAVAEARPGFAPASLLDAGSGPGTSMWAAAAIWPGADAWSATGRIMLLDDNPLFQECGKRLATFASAPGLGTAVWRRADLSRPLEISHAKHDLVTAAYVLGELSDDAQQRLVRDLWDACGRILVLVEPGTPAGFARIMAARTALIALGAAVLAPCPHDGPCPLTAPDWCHFATRIERTQLHRRAKSAALGYEDEKFSYVAVEQPVWAAAPAFLRPSRVLRAPHFATGHVDLTLCTKTGVQRRTVSRRAGPVYRLARKLRWGNGFDENSDGDDR